ncbi:lysine--tRNA ligase [Aurantiacibacter gangjinensis]|uniref:Lysine--tRNA ligase n=1 Tax=Aurantiacibacter gangjinensis TaxID=502682 RepID=A0A0G9MR51_9SPHN|nr:lysine--tRNA ligase [Aurantiacibacter gangjinensis]APE29100.1 Lysyl-tRNA synthetase (class I) [Aurantiacibacter gangjinensis]KLE33187.1 lysine--tRNA ligase [Aurantiacibacter gangjinensis]
MFSTDLIAAARSSKAWPFVEAQRLAKRFRDGKPGGEPVLFETGYGPSGLPHIGTFQEVLRTTLVRKAYEIVGAAEDGTPAPTRLVAFSDDMDGLRKVPDNLPNPAMLAKHLGKPLCQIPDPFEKYESFAHHNNAMLRDFLDRFGFEYEFVAASDRYNSGAFDGALANVLRNYDSIMDIMLPTLREERRQTYSPVLPVSPTTGAVLQVPVEVVDADAGMVRFTDEDGSTVEQSVFGGQAKLQWKVDWAMRWVDLGVDYEMYGKDLTDSGVQSGRIAKVLGGRKPEGMIYEMFLDAAGEKISKSKGNGLSIEEWLTYGSQESLSHYIYANPKSAKQLHAGIIPRAVDEYWQFRERIPEQELDKQLGNPAWHLLRVEHGGDSQPPQGAGDSLPVTYGLLLNLASVLGTEASADSLRDYVASYSDDAAGNPHVERLIETAIAYNRDFVAPTLNKRAPTDSEAGALRELDAGLQLLDVNSTAEELQSLVYEIGKKEQFGFTNLRDWFRCLYETLLGSSQGPRMGSFIALYGIENTRSLIEEALNRDRASR